ncbi:MAG: divalent cation tolerance protein CutA [Candidatus Heimdallarchaeaceae archaeon]
MSYYKIITLVPEEIIGDLMDELNRVVKPIYPNYDYVFTYSKVISTWRPLSGSNPFKGKINQIEHSSEIKLEINVHKENIDNVISTIKKIHPYECPVIEYFEIRIPSF